MKDLVIEEHIPDHLEGFTHKVIWHGTNPNQAVVEMQTIATPNRLELWGKDHAEGPQGFAPMAFRAANTTTVMLCPHFVVFDLNLSEPEVRKMFPV